MDITVQTKISVLLEKIHYLNLSIQQQGGGVNKVDKDLLTNYVRELYEIVLSLPEQSPNVYYGQPTYPSPTQNQPPSYPVSTNGFYLPGASPIGNVPPTNPQPAPHPQPLHPYPQTPQQPLNGSYAQPQTNGTPQQQPSQSQPSQLNPAFTFTNGKRTLSESIRIKTAETEKPSLNEQFKKDESNNVNKLQLTPIKDLKTFIGLNKRFSYINFLFGNDANLYDEAIEKLNTVGSRELAFDYLQNHLSHKLKWSSDNEMVHEFYQLVDRRYMG